MYFTFAVLLVKGAHDCYPLSGVQVLEEFWLKFMQTYPRQLAAAASSPGGGIYDTILQDAVHQDSCPAPDASAGAQQQQQQQQNSGRLLLLPSARQQQQLLAERWVMMRLM